ncbi:hypothetical protein ABK040_002534 [Willaertia magna]
MFLLIFSIIVLFLLLFICYKEVLRFELNKKKILQSKQQEPLEILSNQHIVITGASSGIGKELLNFYVKKGKLNKIIIASRSLEELEKIKLNLDNLYKFNKNEIYCLKIDVSLEEDCKFLILKSLEILNNKINIIYLNAGRTSLQSLKDSNSLQPHHELMNINYFGCITPTFYLLQQLRLLYKNGINQNNLPCCHICIVSSLAGLVGALHRTSYSASKFALNGFYSSLKLELLQEGIYDKLINISIACPGFVKTNIHFNAVGAKGEENKKVERNFNEFMEVEECVARMLTNIYFCKDFLFILPYMEKILLKYVKPFMPDTLYDNIILRKSNAVKAV